MSIVKLTEPYTVTYLRSCVRDSLQYHGERAVLLSMYREEDDVQRCPRCASSEYLDAEEQCPVCYGTSWFSEATGQGGVKMAAVAWCQFTDHVVTEQYGQFGTLEADQRQVQCEAFPMLVEHDYIVRVRQWGDNNTVVRAGEFFEVTAVTRNSLRTGPQYGQTWRDVIGQAATVNWVPPRTKGVTAFPVEGWSFPDRNVGSSAPPNPVPASPPSGPPVAPPPGTPFLPGAGGGSPQMITYTQTAPSALWTVAHALGHDPEVTVVVDGQAVSADVSYPSPGLVLIAFGSPQSGVAVLV